MKNPGKGIHENPPPEFDAYSVGVCYASVCTTLSVDAATKRLNHRYPTGLDHGWKPAEDKTFASGEPNPCVCNHFPSTHKHYLFSC